MVPIRNARLLLLGALLALTACGRPPAPPTPIEVPIGGGPSVGGTSPVEPGSKAAQPVESGTQPGQPGPLPKLDLVPGKRESLPLQRDGQTLDVTGALDLEALTITGLPGRSVILKNPFGEFCEATVQPFHVQGEDHLLATLTDGRTVLVWVLVPEQTTTLIALQTQVDWGAAIQGEQVKLSWRKYKDDGGFYIVSDLYQFSPRTRQYERAPA